MAVDYRQHFHIGIISCRRELNGVVAKLLDWTVQDGPFAGMRMTPQTQKFWSMFAPALIGCFEAEMHDTIRAWAAKDYDLVINVGFAEGYYVVGFGRLFPRARVIGFEINPAHAAVCRELAAANGVADRIDLRGRCDAAALRAALQSARRPLVVIDCEGAELDILSGETVDAAAHADLLVECHDAKRENVTPELSRRFASSHAMTILPESGRNPNQILPLRRLSSFERWLLIWEGRNSSCSWMALESRASLTAAGGSPSI